MWKRRKKDVFYYPGVEIPQQNFDKYRCLDAATKGALLRARGRIDFMLGCLILAFCILIGKLFYLTIVNYEPRNFKPSVLKTEYTLLKHNIVDRHGIVLATTLPTTDLSVNPRKIKDPEVVAIKLVQALPDLEYEDVLAKLTSDSSFKYIKRNLLPQEHSSIMWIGNQYLQETKGEQRAYPHGPLFSHALGGVNIDNVGTAGLEKSYEDELKQADLVLSLDTSVQEMVRQSLENGIKKHQAVGGMSVVMDVNNGEILALVSLPDYDPNLPAKKNDMARFNKASLGSYEFGSVFKLFNTAMALEYNLIKPTDVFDASEPLKIGRKRFEDFRAQNRPLMVPEVLMHSSNLGSILIAQKAGWEKQKEFLGRFGFYDRLDVRLPERGWPQYPTGSRWGDITSANVSFGYGLSVTPLHLIAGVAALANGGYYHVPTFVKGGNDGRAAYKVINEKTSEIMRHLMWGVINWEIKKNDPVYGYAVGGKTGSANLIEDGKYVQGSVRTSFVGVFPMDKPKYIVMVTLEDPKKLKEFWYFNNAGWNAKPIGLEIIAQIAPYLGVVPQEQWIQPDYMNQAIETSLDYKKNKKRQ